MAALRLWLLTACVCLTLFGSCTAEGKFHRCSKEELEEHPLWCEYLGRAADEVDGAVGGTSLVEEIVSWSRGLGVLVGENFSKKEREDATSVAVEDYKVGVVMTHGMGDSCFNSGMQKVVGFVKDTLGGDDAYVKCIPIGKNQQEDTLNGYFKNMDASVDSFAASIMDDPVLSSMDEIHAIGFSQGNNIVRGYIIKYNDAPTIHTFLSVNGVNAGVAAVPQCVPSANVQPTTSARHLRSSGEDNDAVYRGKSFCEALTEETSRSAYTAFTQRHSFQANYWRDPRPSQRDNYLKYSQLARWNNEDHANRNATFVKKFLQTSQFIWVLATEDTTVWPREGEQWGKPQEVQDDPWSKPVLTMKETDWYQQDWFGLQTANEAGKFAFEQFDGDHLQFTEDQFREWLVKYLKT